MASLSPTSDQLLRPMASSSSDRARQKRKKKMLPQTPSLSQSRPSLQRWRSEKQQQIYSTKLVQALRELRISRQAELSPASTPRGGRAVHEAADRTLAVAARGRTLWSRALLASRSVKVKFRKQKRPKISNLVTTPAPAGNFRSRKQRAATVLRLKAKNLPTVQRKVKVLGRLVPGCRKQSIPVVLEETIDYIVAKQMQIRAMTAILNSGSSSSAPEQQSVWQSAPPSSVLQAADGEQT